MTPLSPEERAGNIGVAWCLGEFTDEKYVEFVKELKTQIREAEKVAFNNGRQQGIFECRNAKDIAYAQAREQAAKIIERLDQGYGNYEEVAEDIRRMKPEGKCEYRSDVLEEAAKAAEEWRCYGKQGTEDKCYACDCGNEVPQDAISAAIRELKNK